MSTLIIIILTIGALAILTTIIDLIVMFKHCTAGFAGYDDEWDNELYEKMHYIIAPISLILMIISGLLAAIVDLITRT